MCILLWTCRKSALCLRTYKEPGREVALSDLAPLQLIFDRPLSAVLHDFDAFLLNHTDIWRDTAHQQGGTSERLHQGCLGFNIEWSDHAPELSGFRTVFTGPYDASACSAVSLNLWDHLKGGQRSPPIAAALLSFGAKLAAGLGCKSVKWNPGKLISDSDFFIDSVDAYAGGGAFPVLVTVDFDFSEDEAQLQSTGLEWFSGQEIIVFGGGLRGQDLVRRAVRLVHDIATNGPVFQQQLVPDLEDENCIELAPQAGNAALRCQITARTDQENGVAGIC